jgi:hypothetical protein
VIRGVHLGHREGKRQEKEGKGEKEDKRKRLVGVVSQRNIMHHS